MIDLDKIEQQCKGAIESGYGHLPVWSAAMRLN